MTQISGLQILRRLRPAAVCGLVVLTGAVACDSAPSRSNQPLAATESQEGARLKVPIWQTADGFRQQQGRIYDSGRAEDCTFMRATDGRWRCMPAAYTDVDPLVVFADSGCAQVLATTWNGDARYGRFAVTEAVCEDARFEYRELAGSFEGAEVYKMSEAGCQPMVRSLRTGYRHAGPALAPDLFVGAEEVGRPPGGTSERLTVVSLRADDGAMFNQGLFDTTEGARCEPILAADGRIRCLPVTRYYAGHWGPFGGLDCNGPHLAAQVYCPRGDAPLVAQASAECPRRTAIHAAKEVWPGERSTNWPSAGCVPGFRTVGPLVEVGAEMAPARFVELERDRSGGQRLRHSLYTDGNGAKIPESANWVYDSLLDEQCAFTPAAGGPSRCTPPLLPTLFGDATCSQVVAGFAVTPAPDECDTSPAQRYLMVGNRLHHRGERVDLTGARVFIQTSSGQCTDASNFTADSVFAFFGVGAEVNIELVTSTAAGRAL